ncbi:nitrate reductase [Moorella thermoacetica]|uniref:Nitrate reductase n=2 Tax=Neomoorella thermoacetica TaxID=1525 RepID=A0A1J5JN80_NEOTH|nr:nitrate reductase [Moorella thermoacetica]
MAMAELEEGIVSLFQDRKGTAVDRWVATTCGYCGTGCGLYLGIKDDRAVAVKADTEAAVNKGHLCLKGFYEWKTLHHPERAKVPLCRRGGEMHPVTWEKALEEAAQRLRQALAAGGPEAVGIYHGGQLTLEEYYAIHKLAKGVLGTPNIDANTRLCMASTVSGYTRSFGVDAPPGCYEDLDVSRLVFIFGANPAEMHPQLWQRILRNRKLNGARIMVADPRLTLPARVADLRLRLRCGSNIPLLYGLINILIKEDMLDRDFIRRATAGFEDLARAAAAFPPERVADLTGVPAADIVAAARLFGRSPSAVTVFCQGVNQSSQAVDTVTLINSLHLITGKIGRPGSAPFSLTGQASALSMREIGGGGSLPGFRNPENPEHRRQVADYWGIPEERLPRRVNDINRMLELIDTGRLKVLWVIGTNPAVSLPDLGFSRRQLEKVFLIVQDIFYPMETAAFADIFLPGAGWGEKTGVVTNSERRLNLVRRAVAPPGEARDDLAIVSRVARYLGAGGLFAWQGPEDAFRELRELTRGRPNDMTGVDYALLERLGGVQWPCPEGGRGTPRLYTDVVFPTRAEEAQGYGEFNHPEGRARLWAVPYAPPPEVPDGEFPFWLNTGRIIEHYHTRTRTKRIPELQALVPGAYVEINPHDAARLKISEGEVVRVVSRRGWIEVPARLTEVVAEGEVFVPFHFGDLDPGERERRQAANHLTGRNVDPLSGQPLAKAGTCRIERKEAGSMGQESQGENCSG